MAKQVLSYFYHVSGAHSYQQITGSTVLKKERFDFIEGRKIAGVCSQSLHLLQKGAGTDAKSIRLPGGIYIRQHYPVCQGQSLGEFIQQSLGSGVSVGLNTHQIVLWG